MIGLLQQTAPAATEALQPSAPAAVTVTTVPIQHTDTVAPVADHGAAVVVVDPAATDVVVVHGATGHDAAAAATHAVGMPQLDVTTFANQIFWLALTLLLIWWVLSRIALPRIGGVLADRSNAISGDLGSAEEFKRKARDAEAAYDRALAEARGQAQGIVAEQKAAMQAEIDRAVAHADAEIAARTSESERRIGEIRASSMNDARSVARDVTAEIVRVFGGEARPDAIDAAVDRRLQGIAR